jgi:poly(3-hydroxyalkanoate) synthetase
MNIIKYFLSSTKYKNVILIGYSKGGLTCLNTLVNMPSLIKKVITINSPVQGTRTANIFLPKLTKKFIDTKNELEENSKRTMQLKSVMLNYLERVFHIISKNEFMIYPYTNGLYDYSNYFLIENWYYSHIGFTFNKKIIPGIIQFICYQ